MKVALLPSGADPDGAGSYESYPGGFDEMMNVRHLFRAFPGFPGEDTTSEGWCEDATAYAKQVLGLAANWGSQPAETRPDPLPGESDADEYFAVA